MITGKILTVCSELTEMIEPDPPLKRLRSLLLVELLILVGKCFHRRAKPAHFECHLPSQTASCQA
jgi:hypothetical protein